MSNLKRNVAANFAGNIWNAVVAVAFVPFYIKFLGIEAYGLIGFFTSLTALMYLFDLGLATTFGREIARFTTLPNPEAKIRNLIRTFEAVYWGIAVVMGLLFFSAAPFLTHHWLKQVTIPPDTLFRSILLMAAGFMVRWPSTLYNGGLLSLQRQVTSNFIQVAVNTLKGPGAVMILWLYSNTLEAFFAWQIFVNLVSTLGSAFFLWRTIPGDGRPIFEFQLLKNTRRFSTGITGINVISLLLVQLDKIVLSRILPLSSLGYYTFANNVASSVRMIITPLSVAFGPKFSKLVAEGGGAELKILYHKGCQAMAWLIFPAALSLSAFSYLILTLWTKNSDLSLHASLPLSILTIGTMINGLMIMPYNLQLAYGWTRPGFIINLVFLIFLAPLLVVASRLYGTTGAASVWVVLNLGYFFWAIPWMHRHILMGEMGKWYLLDVCRPLAICLLVVGGTKGIQMALRPSWMEIVIAVAGGLTALLITGYVTPAIRPLMGQYVKRAFFWRV